MSRTNFSKRILSFTIALIMMLLFVPVFDESSSAAALTDGSALDISTGNIVVGATTITHGSNTYDFTENLTITGTTTANTITVESNVSVNITLSNVSIDVSGSSGTPAFKIADDSTGKVTVTLADGTANTLKSGENCAGLQKNGGTGTLTINGTGSLTAKGGKNGAGIGGGNSGSGSYITISGGTVNATGGKNGAGIGGGNSGSGSYITISGGTVYAEAGSTFSSGIGGGNSGSGSNITISGGTVTVKGGTARAIGGGKNGDSNNIVINGGSVKTTRGSIIDPRNAVGGDPVYPLELPVVGVTSVIIDGKDFKPTNHNGDETIYVYLTADNHDVVINGTEKTTYYFEKNNNSFHELVLFKISATNGEKLRVGKDYTYKDGVLTILSGKPVTIANDKPAKATTHRIVVKKDISANITLAGVIIDVSNLSDASAFKIEDNSKGNVTITLAEGSENILKSGERRAGLQKNGDFISENKGKLTIKGTGSLEATGGSYAAGIGAGGSISNNISSSNITILGGTIIATGDFNAAGIGGSGSGNGSHIIISGGIVTATGGQNGAGIGGGGQNGSGSDITITGGTVTAKGTDGGAGIGGGEGGSGSNFVITGGSVKAEADNGIPEISEDPTDGKDKVNKVYLLDIDTHGDPVKIITATGKTYNAPFTHSTEEHIYVYLPEGTEENPNLITINGHTIKYYHKDSGGTEEWIHNVEDPVITPKIGQFSSTKEVKITCATKGATIYYTMDGSDPTTASTVYTGKFTITKTATIKAIAVKDGMTPSAIVTQKYLKKSSGGSGGGSGGSSGPSYHRGTISKEVQLGENAPKTKIATPLDELADIVLTYFEQLEIYDGVDIKIILTVDVATQTVSTADKLKIETAISGLPGYKPGLCLDINLHKVIGSVREKITETSKLITITFEVPEDLRGEKREYAAVRVHNGITTILADLDNDDDTVTIQTDKFSTYAIIYKDTKDNTSGGSTSGDTSDSSTSGDTSDSSTSGDTSDSSTSDDSSDSSTSDDSSDSSTSGDTSDSSTSDDSSDSSTSGDSSDSSTSGDSSDSSASDDSSDSSTSGDSSDSSTSGGTSDGSTSEDTNSSSDGSTSDFGDTDDHNKNPITGTSAMAVCIIAVSGALAAVLVRASKGKK